MQTRLIFCAAEAKKCAKVVGSTNQMIGSRFARSALDLTFIEIQQEIGLLETVYQLEGLAEEDSIVYILQTCADF